MASPRSVARPAFNPRRLPDGGQQAGGLFLVTGITGTRNGNPITGLIPTGTFLGNENLLNAASAYVSFGGIGFVSNG